MHQRDVPSSFIPTPTLDLGTADLSGAVPKDRRAAITSICVHAILATPAGIHVDKDKFEAFIDSRFDRLCDGKGFDFDPILRALLKIEGVKEQELYVGIVNVMAQLLSMDVVMEEPRMSLDLATRQRLLDEARAATETARSTFERRRLRDAIDHLDRQRIGDLMVARSLIDESQLAAALASQEQHGGRLGTNLVEMGFVTPPQLATFLSEQLDLPCVTTIGAVPGEVLALVPSEIALRHKVFPVEVQEDRISLAMADPSNLEAIEAIERASGLSVQPCIAPELVISYAIARHYHVRQPERMRAPAMVPRTADAPEHRYDLADLASDFARADDRMDVLAVVQRFLLERFRTSAVFDVADGIMRGFSASGTSGDPRDIRNHFENITRALPDRQWFRAALELTEQDAVQVIVVRVDGDAAAVLAGVEPTADIDASTVRKLTSVTAAALRMIELREEIMLLAER